jgi:hypothetical protein
MQVTVPSALRCWRWSWTLSRSHPCNLKKFHDPLQECKACRGIEKATTRRPLRYCGVRRICVISFHKRKNSNSNYTLYNAAKIKVCEIIIFSEIVLRKKSTPPPQLLGLDYLTPSTMKRSILPLNSPKPVKLPSAVLKRRICHSNRDCYSNH